MNGPAEKPGAAAEHTLPERRAFALGRTTPRGTVLMVLRQRRSPIAGPWSLTGMACSHDSLAATASVASRSARSFSSPAPLSRTPSATSTPALRLSTIPAT